jgi:hypothetical protein
MQVFVLMVTPLDLTEPRGQPCDQIGDDAHHHEKLEGDRFRVDVIRACTELVEANASREIPTSLLALDTRACAPRHARDLGKGATRALHV